VSYLAYQLLIYALSPFALLWFVWRGLRDRAYWQDLPQRLGFGQRFSRPSIWVHAVSVGEVQAAIPLLNALAERYPDYALVLTTVTPTGRQRGRAILGEKWQLRYLPYDLPGAVKRFFDRIQPRVAIIIEKELWPNLYRECGRRKVPLVLASAAVSPRSVARYRRLVVLFRETLSHGLVIAAQSADDAARFVEIGAPPERTHVVGNIKFDATLPIDIAEKGRAWRQRYGAVSRLTIVAGSTYEQEERALLAASDALKQAGVDNFLVIAPRHPARFDAVARALQQSGKPYARHSLTNAQSGNTQPSNTQPSNTHPSIAQPEVLLLDTLGELAGFYAAADIAYVGGSLLEGVGGHNALEPAALGVPVVMGPHVFNTQEIFDVLTKAGNLQCVDSPSALSAELIRLAGSPEERAQRGEAGQQVVAGNRGTTDRIIQLLEPLMRPESSTPTR
jgi:3-deoxy-D-manno-octulosonic-acid transferase